MLNITKLVDRWTSKWDVALLEVLVLDLMAKKPRYGGELVDIGRKFISESTRVPTIYGMLTRFGNHDLIKEVDSRSQEGVTRGTSRKYYGLTDAGKKYLHLLKDRISQSNKVMEMIESTGQEEFV